MEDARRGMEMFRQLNVRILGVVENMSYLELADGSRLDIFGTGGGEQLAKEGGVPFFGTIPIDALVRAGGDDGKPIIVENPKSPAAIALRSIAEQIAAKVSVAAIENKNVIPITIIE
jgi:ATP-binding protein involved in chromosome partitioning